MSQGLATLFDEKNQMIVMAQLAEARKKFYADKVKVTDFDGTVVNSKKEFIETREKFVDSIAKVHEITLLKSAVGEDVTFAEFIFDFEMGDGSRIRWHEIIESKWKDGLVVEEQYFKG
jgi:hypothetical protein